MTDKSSSERLRQVLSMIDDTIEPPTNEVRAIGVYLRAQLAPFSDTMEVDSGFGFGEACLDFWMDGKAIRVVVQNVPELDKGAGHDRGRDYCNCDHDTVIKAWKEARAALAGKAEQ